ncbi:MAG: hypothetical protein PHS48_02400 [Bacteroidales bacterium]|nr:hypothetical protein [Bacteroidales bacterium]
MQKITWHFLICFLISGLILVSCNSQKKQITETLSQMMDKEIVFPNALQAKILGRDTIVDVLKKPGYKIVTYADSSGCTDCRLNFYGWKLKMNEAKTWSKPVDVVFILQPKDESALISLLKFNDFSHAIFYDKNTDFIRQNQLSSDPLYQTFLINSENKIVLVGNPVSNSVLWKLYKETIESQP